MVIDPSRVNCIRLLDGNILADSKTLETMADQYHPGVTLGDTIVIKRTEHFGFKEGCLECDLNYIEQNCLRYFLSLQCIWKCMTYI